MCLRERKKRKNQMDEGVTFLSVALGPRKAESEATSMTGLICSSVTSKADDLLLLLLFLLLASCERLFGHGFCCVSSQFDV